MCLNRLCQDNLAFNKNNNDDILLVQAMMMILLLMMIISWYNKDDDRMKLSDCQDMVVQGKALYIVKQTQIVEDLPLLSLLLLPCCYHYCHAGILMTSPKHMNHKNTWSYKHTFFVLGICRMYSFSFCLISLFLSLFGYCPLLSVVVAVSADVVATFR